jgi:glycosyltransferase involved in cell wall biosynthesis
MQKRKRIDDLLEAFNLLNLEGAGLILVGPDTDGILQTIQNPAVYKLGEIYGEEILNLLAIADVYCLPGHVGLSIVDAFYFGLPLVTENVDHAPEIMYLRDGKNGFMVEKGDIEGLAQKLRLLLTDDSLREKFSNAAQQEIFTNGHIDNLCQGFLDAINFSTIAPQDSTAIDQLSVTK